MREDDDEHRGSQVSEEPTDAASDEVAPMAARARTLLHMKHLLAGATASFAMVGCSSRDAVNVDAGPSGSTLPVVPVSAAPSSSASTSPADTAPVPSASAAPSASASASASAPPPDAGTPVRKPPPKISPRPPRPSGYEVVDMLPPPPMLLILGRRKKKKPPKKPA